jgi:uncharacterized membrane protein (UPF0182 family)
MKWLFRLWQDLKRALARPAVRRLISALVLLWLCDGAVYFWTETHWQHAAGFGSAWQARVKAQLLLFGATFGITLLLGLFLKPLSQLPANPPRLASSYKWVERRLQNLMRFGGRAAAIFVVIAACWNGWIAAAHWPQWLFFLHGENWGYAAPLWSYDVSWWIFRLPFLELLLDVLGRALWLVLLCGLLLSVSRGAARFFDRRPALPLEAMRSLALLGISLFLVRVMQFALTPLHEMSSLVLDAASWNARLWAWWLGAVFNLWPAALLLFFVLRNRLLERVFAFSVVLAFCTSPILLFTFSRLAPLFWGSSDDAFIAARHATTRHAWGLDEVETRQWNPLTAPRKLPQNQQWLKHLHFDDASTPNRVEQGAIISLDSHIWRFLWAWRQRDVSLLRTSSDFAPHQTLEAQRKALAPFLLPGNALRRVEVQGKVFHLQELLIATNSFAGANSETIEDRGQIQTINSARAAVLLVQEVPNGAIKFYALQTATDALTRAWQNALPGLILPFTELPKALQNKRRYPAELLKRQAHQLSEVIGARWHMAGQRAPSGWLQMQEPVFASLPDEPDNGKFSFKAQIALCSDTNGQTLAALLYAACEGEAFGKLSLLRFDNDESALNSLAPLDSGLMGPNVMAERMAAFLKIEPNSGHNENAAPQWSGGMVMPVAAQHQVWLWQPIFRQRGSTKTLAGLAVTNAAWSGGPIGLGRDPRGALHNWQSLAAAWNSSNDWQRTQNLTSRLRAFLEPGSARQEAEVARLIELATKLHQAAQVAEKTDRSNAQWLRRQQGSILKELQALMPHNKKEGQ